MVFSDSQVLLVKDQRGRAESENENESMERRKWRHVTLLCPVPAGKSLSAHQSAIRCAIYRFLYVHNFFFYG